MTLNERLLAYLWKWQHARYQLGISDCGIFTCGWVDTELGTIYGKRLSAMSKASGLTRLNHRIKTPGGYAGIVEEFCGLAGTPGPGRLGDIGIFAPPNGDQTLGVQSVRLVHVPSFDGLISFDSNLITIHWSLECLRQQPAP